MRRWLSVGQLIIDGGGSRVSTGRVGQGTRWEGRRTGKKLSSWATKKRQASRYEGRSRARVTTNVIIMIPSWMSHIQAGSFPSKQREASRGREVYRRVICMVFVLCVLMGYVDCVVCVVCVCFKFEVECHGVVRCCVVQLLIILEHLQTTMPLQLKLLFFATLCHCPLVMMLINEIF